MLFIKMIEHLIQQISAMTSGILEVVPTFRQNIISIKPVPDSQDIVVFMRF